MFVTMTDAFIHTHTHSVETTLLTHFFRLVQCVLKAAASHTETRFGVHVCVTVILCLLCVDRYLIRLCVSVCMCLSVTVLVLYIYIYICLFYVCVCVCVLTHAVGGATPHQQTAGAQ